MTSGFTVEPEDLRGFSRLNERASDDFIAASSYVSANTDIGFSCSGDLWNMIFGDHEERVSDAKDLLGGVGRVLEASKKELSKSADYYQKTDQETAQKIDATYPESGSSVSVKTVAEKPGSFRDVSDAASALKPVGGPSGWLQGHIDEFQFAPANKTLGTLLDLGSPSALVNEGLKLAFDVDILGQISNWLAGNWQDYANCADAWGNLARFCGSSARNIRNGNAVLAASWDGNAADVAEAYFSSFAKKLDSSQEAFDSLREYYVEVARAIFSFGEFVKGAVAGIFDLAIEAAVAAAASAALAASGVGLGGAFVSGAIAAERIMTMVERYAEIVKAYERIMTLLNGLVGVGGVLMAKAVDEVRSFPVAGNAYDNKVV